MMLNGEYCNTGRKILHSVYVICEKIKPLVLSPRICGIVIMIVWAILFVKQ
jgi:hypothetical protein